jgi:hypothetical protein
MAISDVSAYPSERQTVRERERERGREKKDNQNNLFFKFFVINLVTSVLIVG